MGIFDFLKRSLSPVPKDGVSIKYFKDLAGKDTQIVESMGEYLHGKEHGEWLYNHENKQLKSIGFYIDGKKEREWREYDAYGRLILVYNCRSGVLEGHYRSIKFDYSKYEHTSLETTGQYKNGLKEGRFEKVYHAKNKTLLIEFGDYHNDIKIGLWEEASYSTIDQGIYLDGKREGEWKSFKLIEMKKDDVPYRIARFIKGQLITSYNP
jgi:antitoxin component YwqK of YwqJK toxin-antitoxin module